MRQLATLLGLVLFCPRPVLAWGDTGHPVIALIAQARLSPGTAAKVKAILGAKATLARISSCADALRNSGINCAGTFYVPKMEESRGWHYIDVPITDSPGPSDLDAYCHKDGQDGNCAPAAIRAQMAVLKDASASKARKQVALMFLVHFVGDLHQPLHCATELDGHGGDDLGGNAKPVTFPPGTATEEDPFALNLHHVWDNFVMPDAQERELDPGELAKTLDAAIKPEQAQAWKQFTLESVSLESFAISKESIYPAYHAPGGRVLSPEYQVRMRALAFEQVEKAGVRLAALLEEALSE